MKRKRTILSDVQPCCSNLFDVLRTSDTCNLVVVVLSLFSLICNPVVVIFLLPWIHLMVDNETPIDAGYRRSETFEGESAAPEWRCRDTAYGKCSC